MRRSSGTLTGPPAGSGSSAAMARFRLGVCAIAPDHSLCSPRTVVGVYLVAHGAPRRPIVHGPEGCAADGVRRDVSHGKWRHSRELGRRVSPSHRPYDIPPPEVDDFRRDGVRSKCRRESPNVRGMPDGATRGIAVRRLDSARRAVPLSGILASLRTPSRRNSIDQAGSNVVQAHAGRPAAWGGFAIRLLPVPRTVESDSGRVARRAKPGVRRKTWPPVGAPSPNFPVRDRPEPDEGPSWR
jgi:hypothetical protein